MPDQEKEARTEPATPRRRQEARERGQVAKSQDLASGVMLLLVVLFMRFWGGHLFWGLTGLVRSILGMLKPVGGGGGSMKSPVAP